MKSKDFSKEQIFSRNTWIENEGGKSKYATLLFP